MRGLCITAIVAMTLCAVALAEVGTACSDRGPFKNNGAWGGGRGSTDDFYIKFERHSASLGGSFPSITDSGSCIGSGRTHLTGASTSTTGYLGYGATRIGELRLAVQSSSHLAQRTPAGGPGIGGGVISGGKSTNELGEAVSPPRDVDGLGNRVEIVQQSGSIRFWTGLLVRKILLRILCRGQTLAALFFWTGLSLA